MSATLPDICKTPAPYTPINDAALERIVSYCGEPSAQVLYIAVARVCFREKRHFTDKPMVYFRPLTGLGQHTIQRHTLSLHRSGVIRVSQLVEARTKGIVGMRYGLQFFEENQWPTQLDPYAKLEWEVMPNWNTPCSKEFQIRGTVPTKIVLDKEQGEQAPPPRASKQFQKPTLAEVVTYAETIQLSRVEAEKFFDFEESKGWLVGCSPMRNWQAALRNWQRRATDYAGTKPATPTRAKPGAALEHEMTDAEKIREAQR